MILDMRLTHLDSEASKWYFNILTIYVNIQLFRFPDHKFIWIISTTIDTKNIINNLSIDKTFKKCIFYNWIYIIRLIIFVDLNIT